MVIDRGKKSTGGVKHDVAAALEEVRQGVARDEKESGSEASEACPACA